MTNVLAIWPIAKWILQALGLMGPEDKEAERNFQLKLMTAQEENRKALTEAFASFQTLWRPAAERVYVWGNTVIALLQPALLILVYYDVIWGQRRSVQAAVDLQAAGIPGLFVMAIMLFPFYGPALVQGIGVAFGAAVDLAVKKKNGSGRPAPVANRSGDAVSATRDREESPTMGDMLR